jgi:hypothetical protein
MDHKGGAGVAVVEVLEEGSFNCRDFRVEGGLNRSERLAVLGKCDSLALRVFGDYPSHSSGGPERSVSPGVDGVLWLCRRGPWRAVSGERSDPLHLLSFYALFNFMLSTMW